MKILKKALAAVVILIVLIAVVGLFLPKTYTVERSITIAAPPEAIHEYVGDLAKWDMWSPWKEEDPTIVVTLGGKTSGTGATQSWVGDSGSGSLTVTESSSIDGIEYDLLFEGGAYESRGSIKYYPRPGGDTKVTWRMTGDMGGSVAGGYFALMMDAMVGRIFDKGLSNLKKTVESGA